MKDDLENIEHHLIEQIFKYREILRQKEYLSIDEREADRKELNRLYQHLNSVKQKILDSKCYLQLGEIQKELAYRFLADETTPSQRMEMLAYVLRCTGRPVIFAHGRSVISNYPEGKEETTDKSFTGDKISPEIPMMQSSFKTYELSTADLAEMKKNLGQTVRKASSPLKLKHQLSVMEAEVLSQLAAAGEIPLTLKQTESPKFNIPTSLVLKES